MIYTVRLEPIQYLSGEEVKKIITKAFEDHGGLFIPGVEIMDVD